MSKSGWTGDGSSSDDGASESGEEWEAWRSTPTDPAPTPSPANASDEPWFVSDWYGAAHRAVRDARFQRCPWGWLSVAADADAIGREHGLVVERWLVDAAGRLRLVSRARGAYEPLPPTLDVAHRLIARVVSRALDRCMICGGPRPARFEVTQPPADRREVRYCESCLIDRQQREIPWAEIKRMYDPRGRGLSDIP